MARVVAFVPDLLFGSQVVGMLSAHEVVLVGRAEDLHGALTGGEGGTVLVVDLTDDFEARIAAVSESIPAHPGLRSLAFYSHVDGDVRTAAQAAGLDLVVPRSRMNREGAALVERLAAGD